MNVLVVAVVVVVLVQTLPGAHTVVVVVAVAVVVVVTVVLVVEVSQVRPPPPSIFAFTRTISYAITFAIATSGAPLVAAVPTATHRFPMSHRIHNADPNCEPGEAHKLNHHMEFFN